MTARKMRRWAPVLATALVVSACAGGTADDDSGSATGDNGSTGGEDESEGSGEVDCDQQFSGELTVWHYYDEGAGALFEKIEDWAQRFEESNGATVRFEYVPFGDMASRVTAAAAANEGPDVLLSTGPFLNEVVRAAAVQPIGDYWQAFEHADQFPDEVIDVNTVDGELYAVQAFTNVNGLYYNQDILDELGLDVPTDVESFEAAMEAARDAGYTAFTTGATTGSGGEFALVPWLASAGWSYDDPANESAREVLDRFEQWIGEGFMSPNDATGFVAFANFTTGDYLFAQEGNWHLGTFEDALDFEYGVLQFDAYDRAAIGGEIMSVGTQADDPEAAWCLITQTWFSEQGQLDAAEAGSIPLRADVVDGGALDDEPLLQAYAEIAALSVAIPVHSESGRVSDLLGGVFNELVAEQITAEQAYERLSSDLPPLLPDADG